MEESDSTEIISFQLDPESQFWEVMAEFSLHVESIPDFQSFFHVRILRVVEFQRPVHFYHSFPLF